MPHKVLSGEWADEIRKLRAQGFSLTEVTKRIIDAGYEELCDCDYDQVKRKVRVVLERDKPVVKESLTTQPVSAKSVTSQPTIRDLLSKGAALPDIGSALGVSERVASAMVEDEKARGYNIQEKSGKLIISKIAPVIENRITEKWTGEKIIRFGLMGDTQINSKYAQLTHLHKLYDRYAAEGITTVYHTGDIDEGEQMRPGHQYECYKQGADDHIVEIVRVYPQRKDITTKFISGNHDYSFVKHVGLDIGLQIAEKRKDMVYLGRDQAFIKLTDNCTLELRHPGDGTAYAISYKIQKIVDAMSGGEKPNILAVGHYHKKEDILYRNVQVYQTACLQAQTPWERSKGIAVQIGGWIVEIHVLEDGTIDRIKNEFFPYFKAIPDDYMNWR